MVISYKFLQDTFKNHEFCEQGLERLRKLTKSDEIPARKLVKKWIKKGYPWYDAYRVYGVYVTAGLLTDTVSDRVVSEFRQQTTAARLKYLIKLFECGDFVWAAIYAAGVLGVDRCIEILLEEVEKNGNM